MNLLIIQNLPRCPSETTRASIWTKSSCNGAEDSTDYDRLLRRVDKRVRNQAKKGKAAWSKLEEVLADRKLEKDLKDGFEDE